MAFDYHPNFGQSNVAVAPSTPTAGTSLTITTGDVARLNLVAPFNMVMAPSGAQASTTNAEIVRVTGIAGDVLTIVRNTAGETNNTFNRTVLVGDQIYVGDTSKLFTDIEAAIAALQTSGFSVDGGNSTTTYGGDLRIDYGSSS
jgi:hypothetical protein